MGISSSPAEVARDAEAAGSVRVWRSMGYADVMTSRWRSPTGCQCAASHAEPGPGGLTLTRPPMVRGLGRPPRAWPTGRSTASRAAGAAA